MPQSSADTNLKTVAIFDLDNTITKKDTYVAFLLQVLRLYPVRLLRCAALPLAVVIYKIGMKDNSWLKETFLQAIAGGLNRNKINACSSTFLRQLRLKGIRPGAIAAIKFHQQEKHQLVLATASFDIYVQELAQQLGFDVAICTKSSWDKQEKLTGKIAGQNCYGKHKLARLHEYFGNKRDTLYLIGYTDHHSDQPFLDWVDKAVVINPTEKLKKIALQNDFKISDWEKAEDY